MSNLTPKQLRLLASHDKNMLYRKAYNAKRKADTKVALDIRKQETLAQQPQPQQ